MRDEALQERYPRFTRRAFLRVTVSAAALSASGSLLAACGGGTQPTTTAVGTTAPTAATKPTTAATAAPTTSSAASAPASSGAPSASTTDGKLPSPAPGVPDAYVSAPPPFKSVATVPGKGSKVSAFLIAYLPPPPPRSENKYWQGLEKRLGITLDMTLAPAANYPEKVASITAAGDLPDLMFLDLTRVPNQYKTVQLGAYTDLTAYLSGDGLKEFPNLALFPPQVWRNAAVKGKIYGVPRPRAIAQNTLLYRQDWMEKLGIAHPKNADEFLNMMVAMTKNDPDGNGAADTWGMSAKPDGTSIFNLDFFQGMFRCTTGAPSPQQNGWRLNPDGTLTVDLETDEFKQALAFMRRMVEAGGFHPDAATMSTNQAQDAFISGKIGSFWDSTQSAAGGKGIRGRAKALNPQANTQGFVPAGSDGGKATYLTGTGFFGFTAIPAKVGKDKERAKELLRVLDYYAAPFGSEERNFLQYGIEGVHHTVQPDGTRVLTNQGKAEIGELNNQTNNVPTYFFPEAPGDAQMMQNLVKDLLAAGVDDPTQGFYSPTQIAKASELQQLRIDRLTAIISGRDPLSAFDQYVKDWKSRGGDMIRKEYQDALKGQ